jgi:D-aminopeptidase
MLGLARTGSSESNGSGDYVIAFSAAPGVRIQAGQPDVSAENAAAEWQHVSAI